MLSIALCMVASYPIAATAEEVNGASLASGSASDTAFAIASWVSESSFDGSLTPARDEVMLDGKAQPLGDGVDLKANTTLAFDVQIAEAGNYRIGVSISPARCAIYRSAVRLFLRRSERCRFTAGSLG